MSFVESPQINYYKALPFESDFIVSRADYEASIPIWQRAEAHMAEDERSIFESYSPKNDAERIQKLAHLTQEQQNYYISENVLSYLEEFAGNVGVKKLSGIVRSDGVLEMVGTNVSDMYRHAAATAGYGSREWHEGQGLDKISEGLTSSCNRALWVSPPKFADYGFAFVFMVDEYDKALNGRPMRELLIRYDEPRNTTYRSKEIFQKMNALIGAQTSRPTSDIDFLHNPILYNSQKDEDLAYLYDLVGIHEQDIVYSEQFRHKVLPYIRPWLEEYMRVIHKMNMRTLNKGDAVFNDLEEKGKQLIGAMFNTARIINRTLRQEKTDEYRFAQDAKQMKVFKYDISDPRTLYLFAGSMAKYQELTISGSSCPVTQMAEMDTLTNLVQGGYSIVDSMQLIGGKSKEVCVTCPHCQNKKGNLQLDDKTYICGNKRCPSNKK